MPLLYHSGIFVGKVKCVLDIKLSAEVGPNFQTTYIVDQAIAYFAHLALITPNNPKKL